MAPAHHRLGVGLRRVQPVLQRAPHAAPLGADPQAARARLQLLGGSRAAGRDPANGRVVAVSVENHSRLRHRYATPEIWAAVQVVSAIGAARCLQPGVCSQGEVDPTREPLQVLPTWPVVGLASPAPEPAPARSARGPAGGRSPRLVVGSLSPQAGRRSACRRRLDRRGSRAWSAIGVPSDDVRAKGF